MVANTHPAPRTRPSRKPEFWEKVFILRPRECCITKKVLLPYRKAWRKKCYHINGLVSTELWMSDEAYTFEVLRGRIDV